MAIVGKRLKRLRIQREIKQKDLADRLGVSQAVVSNWERGFSEPPYTMLIRAAEALGANPADFLETEEDAKVPPTLAHGVVNVRFVPVVRNLFLKDLAAPENVQTLAPFPNEGGSQEVIGYRLARDTGTYLANDILFLVLTDEYRPEEQVLIADIATGRIEVVARSGAVEGKVVGAVIGFYRPTRG